jgi:outer membrane murein-binding lipoprotein Lpp
MKQTILAAMIIGTMLLGGCATGSEQQKQVALVLSKCPVLKNYTKDQMKKAASELKSLPSESQVAVLVTDYSKLRDACRVASKKLKQSTKN